MHADEAVHADRFGTLLEGGGHAYDPSEYHGPTLYYLTLPSAWLRDARRYVEVDEATLRAVPAALGVALVAAHLAAVPLLGAPGALAAAFLAAVSPAMVFYSRYYIHEVPLVLFTFAALVGASWYVRRPGAASAVATGAAVGFMLATKETAVVALVSMLLSAALVRLADRRRGETPPPVRGTVRGRDALLALLAAALVAGAFFSSFLAHPGGIVDSIRAYGFYIDRAGTASRHFHPWHYYLGLLFHFPARGTPFWTEGLVLLLALVGGVAGWRGRGVPGADPRAQRFLGLYTLLMVVLYSAVPYKTPWCLLGFLHGMVLLAGAGAVLVVRAARSRATRVVVAVLLLAGVTHLAGQAAAGSFGFAADPRNPYVYAQTGPDVLAIAGRVNDLAATHPDGPAMTVQVVSRENLWPLPWYLRGLTAVQWWNGVSDDAPVAPVVLVTPDMEPSLVRRLYDVPPPGERELYVSVFEAPVELRPGVEVRGYAARGLWEAFRRREAEAGAPSAAGARR
jgi:uncharacterized protein (TIGR03663 family)